MNKEINKFNKSTITGKQQLGIRFLIFYGPALILCLMEL